MPNAPTVVEKDMVKDQMQDVDQLNALHTTTRASIVTGNITWNPCAGAKIILSPKSDRRNTVKDDAFNDTIFDTLCASSTSQLTTNHQTTNGKRTLTLEHHFHDQLSSTWWKRPSKPQPFLNITVRLVNEDYKQLGFAPITAASKSITLQAMADTGCQSCLAGLKCIQRIGLNKSDLIPVTMKMRAANNDAINILGAVILRLSGNNDKGSTFETQIRSPTSPTTQRNCS